jgi:ABC-2 type transport system ATP-binding protein
MPIIELTDVWEMYRIKFIIDGKASWDNFWALRGVSFSVEKGEIVGIIGENGSGKSTVLKLILGMLKPDRGGIKVSGRVAGLLELGAGFQPELTGKENIYLQSELFGLSRAGLAAVYRSIVDFAEIGKFIDAPVKCYSQGMFVRLAFAIAIHMEPDILLIDDTLSVGDEYFQRKCVKKIFELKEQGKTIVIVSHDMAMLQRLCKRIVFLKNGAVVRDDAASVVVPLYSQALGSPAGIAIIDRKPLSVIFNNGRLLLNWNDTMITSSSGAYTALNAASRWYSSTQAEWEVKQESPGAFTAVGKFYQLGLAQIWRVEVSEGLEIAWDVELEADKVLDSPEMYVNLSVNEAYERWFADSEKGDFPAIKDEDKNWNPVFAKNGLSACVGVAQKALEKGEIPSVLFKQSVPGYQAQGSVLNSDYLSHCRILQYKFNPSAGRPVDHTGRHRCFAGQIAVNTADIDGYIAAMRDRFVISNGGLALQFDNGKLALSFNNVPLTKAGCIFASFFSGGRWYFPDTAVWVLEKEGPGRLTARGTWSGLGISQEWRIDICDGHSFTVSVTMDVTRDCEVPQQRLCGFFAAEYKQFCSDYAAERFSDTFGDAESDLLQRCIPSGSVGLQDPGNALPSVFFSFAAGSGNFVKVFNSDRSVKARILHLEKVEPEAGSVFAPGRYECFDARFSVGAGEAVQSGNFDNALRDGNFKFVFDRGCGRLYDAKGGEITKNIALYTSVRSGGRWYDSSSAALWKITRKSADRITAVGTWLDLPVSQEWEFSVNGRGRIQWDATMRVDKEIALDRVQANLMLTERFARWLAGNNEGEFPAFPQETGSDWDCIWDSQDEGGAISLKEDPALGLPKVSLEPLNVNPGWHLKIVNSDRYHRGRVLQYAAALEKHFLPGNYPYFSGIVTIHGA